MEYYQKHHRKGGMWEHMPWMGSYSCANTSREMKPERQTRAYQPLKDFRLEIPWPNKKSDYSGGSSGDWLRGRMRRLEGRRLQRATTCSLLENREGPDEGHGRKVVQRRFWQYLEGSMDGIRHQGWGRSLGFLTWDSSWIIISSIKIENIGEETSLGRKKETLNLHKTGGELKMES